MNFAESLLRKADRLQRGRAWLAIPVATWKKFSDDQAGNLAALIAYYAFGSIFPLLLVFVTILDLVLRNNPSLRAHLLNTALSQYPVAGDLLKTNVHGLSSTGPALVIGLLFTLYGALGIAVAMQNAMNTVWEVPHYRRSSFPWSILRSLGLILVVGPGQVATIALSSIAGGTAHLGGTAAHIGAIAVSLVLNIGLFWVGFRLATGAEIPGHDLWLSAILAAAAWQVLQVIGGNLVAHPSKSAYGLFAIILGLLAWFYLQAQITLYVVELNVVRVRRLWPRSLAPPPLLDADMRAYESYARAGLLRPELEVEVRQAAHAATDAGPPAPQR